MEQLQHAIKEMVIKAVAETVPAAADVPELVTISDIVQETRLDRSVIDALVHGSPSNGFPVARLGPRTVRIDRRRFYQWLAAGGLSAAN